MVSLKTFALFGMILLLVVGFAGCVSSDSSKDNKSSEQSAQDFEDTFGGTPSDSGSGDQPPSPPS